MFGGGSDALDHENRRLRNQPGEDRVDNNEYDRVIADLEAQKAEIEVAIAVLRKAASLLREAR